MLGDELRQARQQCGWTRKRFRARLATDTRVSEQTLATYELGTRSLAVERLVELCEVLDVWAPNVLAQAIYRTMDPEPADSIRMDLQAVIRDRHPALSPLRRWARCRLDTTRPGESTMVHLDQAALQQLAKLCGVNLPELTAALRTLSAQATK